MPFLFSDKLMETMNRSRFRCKQLWTSENLKKSFKDVYIKSLKLKVIGIIKALINMPFCVISIF
jgi:hypothetical protein